MNIIKQSHAGQFDERSLPSRNSLHVSWLELSLLHMNIKVLTHLRAETVKAGGERGQRTSKSDCHLGLLVLEWSYVSTGGLVWQFMKLNVKWLEPHNFIHTNVFQC